MSNTSSSNLFGNLAGSPVPAVATAETDAALAAAAANQDAAGNEETADDDASEAPTVNELDMLKSRARVMGIAFSNNIKVETLRAKIAAKLDGEGDATGAGDEDGDEAQDAQNYVGEVATASAPVVATSLAPVPGSGGSLLAQIATMSAEEKSAILHLLGGSAVSAPAPVAAPAPKPASNKVLRDIALRKEIYDREMRLVRVRITNMDPKKANLPGEILTVANEWLGNVSKFIPYGEATDDGYHIPVCLLNQLKERTFLQIKQVKNANGRGTTPKTADVREFAIEELPPLSVDELSRLATAQAAAAGN